MPYVASFTDIQKYLHSQRAVLVKRSGNGDVYVAANGSYIRVQRRGSGFDLQTFANRAACGCG